MTDNGEQVYAVIGPPGCGKTSYLAEEARRLMAWAHKQYGGLLKKPILICSLTRAAAAEIAGRDLPLPSECVGTLHAHAFRSLNHPMIAAAHHDDFNKSNPGYTLTVQKKASGKNLDDPDWEYTDETDADQLLAQYQLARARMIARKNWHDSTRDFAEIYEQWKENLGVLDFTDLIETAYKEVDTAPGEPLVILTDEAQDNAALEFALLRKWGKAAGKLIVVGDPYQALYCWRGAHPEIFMDSSIPGSRRKILSQSYRVPRAVHAASVRWISQLSNYEPIDYRPRDYRGTVAACDATWQHPEYTIDRAEQYLAKGKSVMMITSCSFMLRPTIEVIRNRGLPYSNPWRTRRGDWNPLTPRKGTSMVQRILDYLRLDKPTYGDHYRGWTALELYHWTDVLDSKKLFYHGVKSNLKIMASKQEQQQLAKQDVDDLFLPEVRTDLREMFLDREQEGKTSLEDLLGWWQERLRDKKRKIAEYPLTVIRLHGVQAVKKSPRLYVGTAHSFKGSQADVVFVYPDLSPAGLCEWEREGPHKDNVIRLFYVALTRAREMVTICNPVSEICTPLGDLVDAD